MIEGHVKLEDITRANANLQRLDRRTRRNVVTRAVREGNKKPLGMARLMAPFRTGSLAKALTQTTKMDRFTGTVTSTIKLNRKKKFSTPHGKVWPTKYMHLVVLGTKPHKITPGNRKGASALNIEGNWRAFANHPGTQADDFLGRAERATRGKAIADFTRAYRREVYKEVALL